LQANLSISDLTQPDLLQVWLGISLSLTWLRFSLSRVKDELWRAEVEESRDEGVVRVDAEERERESGGSE